MHIAYIGRHNRYVGMNNMMARGNITGGKVVGNDVGGNISGEHLRYTHSPDGR